MNTIDVETIIVKQGVIHIFHKNLSEIVNIALKNKLPMFRVKDEIFTIHNGVIHTIIEENEEVK